MENSYAQQGDGGSVCPTVRREKATGAVLVEGFRSCAVYMLRAFTGAAGRNQTERCEASAQLWSFRWEMSAKTLSW